MCLILGGVGNFFFMLGLFSQLIAEGRLLKLWGKRRVQKAIAKLKDHFIVCGHGRIGAIVTREILSEGHQVLVVEHNPETIQRVEEEGLLCIHGDATKDEVLQAANIGRARSLIAALAEEAANVYVTLTARQAAREGCQSRSASSPVGVCAAHSTSRFTSVRTAADASCRSRRASSPTSATRCAQR